MFRQWVSSAWLRLSISALLITSTLGMSAPEATAAGVDLSLPAAGEFVGTVSAGAAHSLHLRADGTVWAWGSNDFGQAGDGTAVERTRPVRVRGLPPTEEAPEREGPFIAQQEESELSPIRFIAIVPRHPDT